MVKKLVCAVYDRKVDAFSQNTLSLFDNDDLARRAVHGIVLDESTEYSRYAADFSLWHVGDYETDNGVLSGVERRKITEFDAFAAPFRAMPQER